MEFIPEDPILEFLPDTLVAIRRIYNMDQGRIDQSIVILEEWITKQNHLVNKNFSREYLEKTVMLCKGSVEKAKKQIDKLCTYKSLLTKFFISTDVKTTFSDLNDKLCAVPLPKMTKDYQRIFFLKINCKEFDSSHFMEFYRLVIVEGFGAKMKGIHIVTPSKVVDILIKTVTPFLSPKLSRRITVHQDLEGLHQAVDRDLLSFELGGNDRTVKELQDEWMEVLGSEKHAEYLAEMRASCTDEFLRQTDKLNKQYMDLPGSFRTLTVD